MRFLLAIFLSLAAFGQNTPAVNVPMSGTPMVFAQSYAIANSSTNLTITNVSTGVVTTIAKAAAVTQSISLFTLPARSYILACFTTLGTSFTGTTALVATVGITGAPTACIPSGLNLQAGSGTIVKPLIAAPILSTNGTDAAILALTSTVDNVSSISAGAITVTVIGVTAP